MSEVASTAAEGLNEQEELPATRDAVLYHVRAEREALYNLVNLLTAGIVRGLVVNAARSGLGTAPKAGPAFEADGLYYQALRIYSAFDWECQRQLLYEASAWPLPRDVTFLAGRFARDYVDSLPHDQVGAIEKYRALSRVLLPRLSPFEARRLDPQDVAVEGGRGLAEFSPEIKRQLWRGTLGKLQSIRRAYSPDAANVHDKLQAMLDAFSPLSTSVHARLDPAEPQRTRLRVVAFFPAFHNLVAQDQDNPETWYLQKGGWRYTLPEPVQISAALVTHLSYLEQADVSAHHATRLELRRDSDTPETFHLVVSFGRLLGPGDTGRLFEFDPSDHRDAVVVGYRMNLPTSSEDSPLWATAKERINDALARFEVDVHVRQLGLTMRRPTHASVAREAELDPVFRPGFSPQNSKISFRVHRYTDHPNERVALMAMGFSSEDDDSGRATFHCYRDFQTWDALSEGLLSGMATERREQVDLLKLAYERSVSRLVGLATREVLASSMADIEDAVDAEVARLLAENMEKFWSTKARLFERLQRGLRSSVASGERHSRM